MARGGRYFFDLTGLIHLHQTHTAMHRLSRHEKRGDAHFAAQGYEHLVSTELGNTVYLAVDDEWAGFCQHCPD